MRGFRAKILWKWRSFRTRVDDRLWAGTDAARRRLHTGYRHWMLWWGSRGDRLWDRTEPLAALLPRASFRRRAAAVAALALAAVGTTGAVLASNGGPEGLRQYAPGVATDEDQEARQVPASKAKPEPRSTEPRRARPVSGAATAADPAVEFGDDTGAGDRSDGPAPTADGPSGAAPSPYVERRAVRAPAPNSSPPRAPERMTGPRPRPQPNTPTTVAPEPPPPAPQQPAPAEPAPAPTETAPEGGGPPPWAGNDGPGNGNEKPEKPEKPEEDTDDGDD